MRRGWFIILALSVGFNIGLLVVQLSGNRGFDLPHDPLRHPPDQGEIRGAAPEFAGPPGRDVKEIISTHLARMTGQLGLSESQRRAIAAGLREYLQLIVQHQRKAHEARMALADYYSTPEMDPDQFRALIAGINVAQAKIDSLVGEAMLSEASVLTAEQRERYFKKMPWGRQGRPTPEPR